MKLSDLELSAYDLIAIVLPGTVGLAEIQIAREGLIPFWEWVKVINLPAALFLGLLAFALGHLISQAAFELARLSGDRFHFKARDRYWMMNANRIVGCLKESHKIEIKQGDVGACDRAFNVCLTIIGDAFEKRKVFSFVAALSLSLWLLSLSAIVPALRCLHQMPGSSCVSRFGFGICFVACCLTCAWLSWRRSQLFFALADTPVFEIFEVSSLKDATKEASTSESDS